MTKVTDQIDTSALDISSRALLVGFEVSQWTARKLDKTVSQQVQQANRAARDSGNYNKQLIDKIELKEIGTIVSSARAYHAEMTLPWMTDGTRIIPADAFDAYTKEMGARREGFEGAVRDFLSRYPDLVSKAELRLGDMFRRNEYPTVSQLAHSFDWHVRAFPVPTGADFRVDLDADVVRRLRDQMNDGLNAALDDAMSEAFSRLHKPIAAMAERLAQYEPDKGKQGNPFRDSLVENLRDVVKVLPSLNLTGNAALSGFIDQVNAKLTKHDPATLRINDNIRKEVAQDAAKIADDMAAFFGA